MISFQIATKSVTARVEWVILKWKYQFIYIPKCDKILSVLKDLGHERKCLHNCYSVIPNHRSFFSIFQRIRIIKKYHLFLFRTMIIFQTATEIVTARVK